MKVLKGRLLSMILQRQPPHISFSCLFIRYPTKIPLVVEKHKVEKSLKDIDKIKWLIPREMTLFQLSAVLKKRLKCPPQQQFFININGR